ncbi:MAG: AMP-binding protein [Phenylobacterium sp.]|uniref:AMP-binding protein n=1 Tax=Phenylobacterium sp. TaxID=1871053 RepID=UPI001A4D7A23|nr:AMP-binding protein [Phenylobacterium sp.]MBL8554401.1 AMP-binding protein [Phenylobacterium sp.]
MSEALPEMVSLGAQLAQLAATKGEAAAVTCAGETLTYAELNRRSNRLARALAAKGVKYGDLVTIGLPNSTGFVAAAYAVWKLGATPQPVSFRLPKAELAAIVELAGSPVVVADFDHVLDVPVLTIAELEALSADDSDLPDVTSPVLKAPTSGGSTGRPKLILAGQPAVAAKATPADPGPFRIRPGATMVIPAPLYHNAPFGMMTGGTSAGCHIVLTPRFDPEGTLAEIQAHKAGWVYLVPTMMNRIWHLPEAVRAKYDLSTVEILWHMAAPCPAWLKEAFIHWIAPGEVMELYAGTEAQAVTIITGTEWLTHRGSVGKVAIGEMKVFGDDGAEAAPGEVGEIYMRRAAGTPETYRYVGATAKVLRDGWESLGDLGSFDAEGYLYLADRRTDMILVGGSNVYPAEIESALQEHPAVESCAVIGLPDDDLGQRIHAIVNARGEVTAEDLEAHVKDRLVTYKQPRSYEFVDEAVRDDAGKVRRTALRDARIAAMKQPV